MSGQETQLQVLSVFEEVTAAGARPRFVAVDCARIMFLRSNEDRNTTTLVVDCGVAQNQLINVRAPLDKVAAFVDARLAARQAQGLYDGFLAAKGPEVAAKITDYVKSVAAQHVQSIAAGAVEQTLTRMALEEQAASAPEPEKPKEAKEKGRAGK